MPACRSVLALLLGALTCLSACSSSTDPQLSESPAPEMTRTILITRHAEKGDFSADPPLSERGLRRAEALSLHPETQSVTTVITTQFRRTVETGAAVAVRQGILSRVANATARPDALQSFADEILESAEYGTVLVVGHSNTVPLIIRQLGGPEDIFLTEEDFGDLFILTIYDGGDDGGEVSFERTRYGD